MSRLAKVPLELPAGVDFKNDNNFWSVKGPLGELKMKANDKINVELKENALHFSIAKLEDNAKAMLGTARSVLSNMVVGCSNGFSKTLKLQGVGYRAKAVGGKVDLTLGYSHPISYLIPKGIEITTPEPTEVVIKGIDKQLVGQVAANIREYRAPEPYKGKGIRYSDEVVVRKEVKKK